MKKFFLFLFTICSFSLQQNLQAQCSGAKAVKVANHETGKDVVDIAIGSPDHTTLVAAVKAADLVGTLKGEGPFTVFAPTNAAFEKLPEGTVDQLLKPENRAKLQTILTYHVVPGNLDAAAVVKAIKENGGKVEVKTVSGGILTAMLKDGQVWLMDENGGKAMVTATDLKASNGVVHVIDTVVLPKG